MTQRTYNKLFIAWAFSLSAVLYGGSLSEFETALTNPLTDEEIEAESKASDKAYEEYIGYVSEVKYLFAEQMRDEFNLHYYGDWDRMHLKVEELGCQFQTERRATIEEARALLLTVMERFVQAINAHEKLQPFLETRPFTNSQIMVSIVFQGINGRYADGSVSRIFYAANDEAVPKINHLIYYAQDSYTGDSVLTLKEPYEEALRLNRLSNIENLTVHQSNEKEETLDNLLYEYRKEMQEKYGLECWDIGGDLTENVKMVGGNFVALRQATQEEARNMLLGMTQSLLKKIRENEQLQPYLVESPFPVERLKLRLSFKKKRKYTTYRNGTMESVTLDEGNLAYFWKAPRVEGTATPTVLFASESYQEALDRYKEPESYLMKLKSWFKSIR